MSVLLCVCVRACVCPSACNNFLVYRITTTILPGTSPHLVRIFLTSIPSFLLLFLSFGKTRWRPCQFFYFICPIDFLLQTTHIPTVKLLLPNQPMHLHYIFPLKGGSNKLILHRENIFSPFNLFTITQKQRFTFTHFEDGLHFQDGSSHKTMTYPPLCSTQGIMYKQWGIIWPDNGAHVPS